MEDFSNTIVNKSGAELKSMVNKATTRTDLSSALADVSNGLASGDIGAGSAAIVLNAIAKRALSGELDGGTKYPELAESCSIEAIRLMET